MTGDPTRWIQRPATAAWVGVEVLCDECGEPRPMRVVAARVRAGRARYEVRVGVCEAWCALLGGPAS